MLNVIGTTLEELKQMLDWSTHQISNETLRALFKNGFTSLSAIAQIRESDLRYLRKHTDINPGQVVLLRGVVKNISMKKKEVRMAETQTLSSEQGSSNASESHVNVSSECEQIVGQANTPTISNLSDSQNNEGTLNTNVFDTSKEQAVMLPQERQNEQEPNQVLNQSLEMSGTGTTEKAEGERTQLAIDNWNFTTFTQSNSLSTLSPNEIDIVGILQLNSNQNIRSDQNNSPANNAFQQSFTATTLSTHGAEGNSGLGERSGLGRKQVDTENEAQQLDPIPPSIGKNEYAYSLRS